MIAVLLIIQLAIAHIHSHSIALFDPYHNFIAAILFASFVTYFLIYISHTSFLRYQHVVLGFIDDDIRLDSPHIAVKRCPWSIMTRYVVMNFFLIITSVIISFIVHIGLLGTDNRTILIISNVKFGFCYLVSTLLTLNIRMDIFLLFTVMSIMSSLGDLKSAYLMMVTYAVLLTSRTSLEAVSVGTVRTESSAESATVFLLVSPSVTNNLGVTSTNTPPSVKTKCAIFKSQL